MEHLIEKYTCLISLMLPQHTGVLPSALEQAPSCSVNFLFVTEQKMNRTEGRFLSGMGFFCTRFRDPTSFHYCHPSCSSSRWQVGVHSCNWQKLLFYFNRTLNYPFYLFIQPSGLHSVVHIKSWKLLPSIRIFTILVFLPYNDAHCKTEK